MLHLEDETTITPETFIRKYSFEGQQQRIRDMMEIKEVLCIHIDAMAESEVDV